MPTCVAQGCGARSDQGEVLKVFPRKDLHRRQIWVERVNRPGWTPTKYSALCERHFDRDQWEVPREDGKRKLKSTAVPTVFCVEHLNFDGVVFKDHAYCIRDYRKLYDNEDDSTELILPIEHIKVEVDENENFSSEVFENEDDVGEINGSNDVEDIQCTPDIFVYPEKGEPDPIEMVDCENEDSNNCMNEPCMDPLAISVEDVEHVGSIVPQFKHSQKYMFVTKETKYVSSLPLQVEGEPVIQVEPPKIKVKSPKCLFKPISAVLQPLPNLEPFDTSCSISKSSPVSSLTNRRVTKQQPPFTQFKSQIHNHKYRFSSTPKLKVPSVEMPFIPKLKGFASSKSNIAQEATAPVYSHDKLTDIPKSNEDVIKVNCTQNLTPSTEASQTREEEIFVKLNPKKSPFELVSTNKMILLKKNGFIIQPNPIENKDVDKTNQQRNKTSIKSCAQLENIFLEHHYTNDPPWKPITINGVQLKKNVSLTFNEKRVFIGSKPIKLWVKKPNVNSQKNITLKRISQSRSILTKGTPINTPGKLPLSKVKRIPTIKSSSVLILKPFDKSHSSTGACSKIINSSFSEEPKFDLYDCCICKTSFFSLATMKMHMETHYKTKISLNNKLDSEVELIKEVKDPKMYEKWETREDVEDIKRKRRKKNRPKRFENNLITIPNLNVMKDLRKIQLKLSDNTTEEEICNVKVENSLNKKIKASKKAKCMLQKIVSSNNDLKFNLDSDVKGGKVKVVRNRPSRKVNKQFKSNSTIGEVILGKSNNETTIILKNNPIVLIPKVNPTFIGSKKSINESPSIDSRNKCKDVSVDKDKKELKDKTLKKQDKSDQNGSSVVKLKCHTCNLMIEKNLLRNHQKLHLFPEYTCSVCNKRFSKSFQLRKHAISDHKVVKSFQCQRRYCGRKFESRRELDKHMRVHKK